MGCRQGADGGSDTTELVTLDDIRAAAARIRPIVRRTPVLEAGGLFLKCENLQVTGAFKIAGGEHIAMLSRVNGRWGDYVFIPATTARPSPMRPPSRRDRGVVMPETAPAVKVDAVRRLGGEVIVAGRTSVDRKARADAEAAARGLTMVPPFDHPWIIAGAGTTGLEILEQCPQAGTVFTPVGGGGQISGVSAAIKQMRSGVRIVGVEPAGAARMSASLSAGHPVTLAKTAARRWLLTLRRVTYAGARAGYATMW